MKPGPAAYDETAPGRSRPLARRHVTSNNASYTGMSVGGETITVSCQTHRTESSESSHTGSITWSSWVSIRWVS